jgi:hypothetical protein
MRGPSSAFSSDCLLLPKGDEGGFGKDFSLSDI